MGERPKHWIKLWVSWLTSPAHLELSGGALGLGPLLLLLATWDGEYASGGWLLGEDGKPYDRNALARATHRSRSELDRQMLELVRVGTLVIDGRGAYGFAHFGKWQETSAATRMRRHRERNSDAGSDAQRDAQTGDGRRETVNSLRSSTPTPPREGSSSGITVETRAEAEHIGGFALTEPKPTGKAKTKPKPAADERIARILDAIDRERARCVPPLPPLTATQRNATTIAAAFGRGATVERLLECVGAWGRLVERDPSKASRLTPSKLFSGPNAQHGYAGGLAWCEELLDEERTGVARSPSSRAANTSRRGPAAPSPRPTESGEVDLSAELADDKGAA